MDIERERAASAPGPGRAKGKLAEAINLRSHIAAEATCQDHLRSIGQRDWRPWRARGAKLSNDPPV